MLAHRRNADALLCGGCGYPLDAVRREPACPECGRPIAESLPAYRIGSPWQRSASLPAWFKTASMLTRWRTLFDRISIDAGKNRWLLRVNLGVASPLCAAAVLWQEAARAVQTGRGWGSVLGGGLLVVPMAYGFVWTLTRIEAFGLRFFGNRRGGRVSPAIARAVVAHASYGWILAGLLAWAGAVASGNGLSTWLGEVTGGWAPGPVPVRPVAIGLGFFAGLLLFETLSYLGILRCRFAN